MLALNQSYLADVSDFSLGDVGLNSTIIRSLLDSESQQHRSTPELIWETIEIQGQVAEQSLIIQGVNFKLEEILKSEALGRAILTTYKYVHGLNTTCQSYLVDIIVFFFRNQNLWVFLWKCNFSHLFLKRKKKTNFKTI